MQDTYYCWQLHPNKTNPHTKAQCLSNRSVSQPLEPPPRQLAESRERGHSGQRADADRRDFPRAKLQLGQQVSHPRPGPTQGPAVTRQAEATAAAPLPPPPHTPPGVLGTSQLLRTCRPDSQPRGLGILPGGHRGSPPPSAAPRPVSAQPASRRHSHWLHILPLKPLASNQTREWKERLGTRGAASASLRRPGRRFPVLFSSLSCARLTPVTAGEKALRVRRSQPSPSFPKEPQTLRKICCR